MTTFHGLQVGHMILGYGPPGIVKLEGDTGVLFQAYVISGVYTFPFDPPLISERFVLTVPKGWPVFVPEGVEVVLSS